MQKWTSAFQIAAVFVGTVVGAGFATGKEIVEFFTEYGAWGSFGICISGLLFIWLGSKMMLLSFDLKATSFEELTNYLFGRKLAAIFNIFMLLMLVGVCAVMFAGAEALFREQLNLPDHTGLALTVLLTGFIMLCGMKGIFAVNTIVVPMMVIFNMMVMLKVLEMEGGLPPSLFNMNGISFHWESVFSAFSYAAFNLSLAQAVLVPMAGGLKDRSSVKLGGVIAGVLLMVILMTSHVSMSTLPDVNTIEIPMAAVVNSAAVSLYFLYILIIYGEIMTSIIGNLFGLGRQLSGYIKLRIFWIYITLILTVSLVSFVEYGRLLGYLYPLYGYISLIFLLMLIMKQKKDMNS